MKKIEEVIRLAFGLPSLEAPLDETRYASFNDGGTHVGAQLTVSESGRVAFAVTEHVAGESPSTVCSGVGSMATGELRIAANDEDAWREFVHMAVRIGAAQRGREET
jgi:hypothetical protein